MSGWSKCCTSGSRMGTYSVKKHAVVITSTGSALVWHDAKEQVLDKWDMLPAKQYQR